MKQLLWFRRDLRITDSALLASAKDEILPIFIFDTHILEKLDKNDRRVTFIYDAVLSLKKQLKSLGLDLAIFHGKPEEIISSLKAEKGFDEIVTSVDFDDYAKSRDAKIAKILPFRPVYDSFLVHPEDALKADGTPYRVFTPFYKSLIEGFSGKLGLHPVLDKKVSLISFTFDGTPTLEELGFVRQNLPEFATKTAYELLEAFKPKINAYKKERDYFYIDATSKLGTHLRFGLISPKEVFNTMMAWKAEGYQVDDYARELFWREFYHYILYHFPKSETENFDDSHIPWREDKEGFEAWCKGETGVPIVDAAMREFNEKGWMHNRLRMVVASFLTKNLLIDWKWGEAYFASKLLDYEAASNIGSWQWAASTGADAAPYFRIFNPYLQSKKFDPDAIYMKSVMPELKEYDAKLFHIENGLQRGLFSEYLRSIVDINQSRKDAIETFKKARDA